MPLPALRSVIVFEGYVSNAESREHALRNRLAWVFAPAVTAALSCVLCAQVPVKPGARAQAGGKSVDLSGVWLERERAVMFSAKEPPMKPWAEEKYRSAKSGYGPHATADSRDPILSCL